ncbi:MAG: hypothetical protein QM628_03670 [Propionicimonas sp.]
MIALALLMAGAGVLVASAGVFDVLRRSGEGGSAPRVRRPLGPVSRRVTVGLLAIGGGFLLVALISAALG